VGEGNDGLGVRPYGRRSTVLRQQEGIYAEAGGVGVLSYGRRSTVLRPLGVLVGTAQVQHPTEVRK
jgi:hypothetical protein